MNAARNLNATVFEAESAVRIDGGLKAAARNSTSNSTPNSNPTKNVPKVEFCNAAADTPTQL
jgi:hypothetical protein